VAKKLVPLNELLSLANQRALVTGGAQGIGYAIAYRLAEAGARVGIIDVNDEKGQQAVQDLATAGYQAFFLRCDVRREEEVKSTLSAAAAKMGGLDILVNNAGIFPFVHLQEMTAADIEDILAVNVKGTLYFSREFSRWLIDHNHGGCIINLASIDSLHPSHNGLAVYDASKGAVLSLTRSLAKELGPYGIRVNAIAPGGIMTEGTMAQSRIRGETSRATLKEFLPRVALGRMGIADDIGRVALFLASGLSEYMTGALVLADGGYLLS
jgi:2-dehydro-3-deoxy-D-gluconate 5-dehydrogenase